MCSVWPGRERGARISLGPSDQDGLNKRHDARLICVKFHSLYLIFPEVAEETESMSACSLGTYPRRPGYLPERVTSWARSRLGTAGVGAPGQLLDRASTQPDPTAPRSKAQKLLLGSRGRLRGRPCTLLFSLQTPYSRMSSLMK